MSDNVEQKIIKTVAETLRVEEVSISPESKFVDDLGADSLDLVELMMAFESEFEFDIPDKDATKISTVRDAINYVHQHTNA